MTDDLDPPSFQFGVSGKGSKEVGAQPAGEDTDAGGADTTPPTPSRGPFRSETLKRILWAIPWIVVAVVLVALGGPVFALAMAAFGVIGLRELFAMSKGLRPLDWPAFVTLTAMVAAALVGGPVAVLGAMALVLPLSFAAAASRSDRSGITISIAVCVLGTVWFGLAFSHAVLLREIPVHGGALLVDVLVATFLADTFAYAGGRLFGSRRITPAISPNKTLEGLIAGVVGGTLGFWFAGLYQDWLPGLDALAMGFVIALVAPLGDLFASLVKRDLGTKDTGGLFGPHGGLIDRLDAVLFTVVAGYYLVRAFGF